ncbi:hypothetical protein FD755_002286 [Muntiacus reevesi]|uniref:SAM domain-containing protein n=1 Tax=Muntiacus reevesi TaxID=9886 RepID=A0A5J5N9F5_MUNRE|nr:hypothetical protein FD755_002286 [Muntiacus reevesi]
MSDTVLGALLAQSCPTLSDPMDCSPPGSSNTRDGGAWWAAVYVVTQSRTQLKRLSSSSLASPHNDKDKEIDGKSLLLMTRNDVLTGLQLKLGPALKIYEYHVKPLQTKHLKYNSS